MKPKLKDVHHLPTEEETFILNTIEQRKRIRSRRAKWFQASHLYLTEKISDQKSALKPKLRDVHRSLGLLEIRGLVAEWTQLWGELGSPQEVLIRGTKCSHSPGGQHTTFSSTQLHHCNIVQRVFQSASLQH